MSVFIKSTSTNKTIDANVPIAVNFPNGGNVNNRTNYNATVTWANGTSNVNVALTPT